MKWMPLKRCHICGHKVTREYATLPYCAYCKDKTPEQLKAEKEAWDICMQSLYEEVKRNGLI